MKKIALVLLMLGTSVLIYTVITHHEEPIDNASVGAYSRQQSETTNKTTQNETQKNTSSNPDKKLAKLAPSPPDIEELKEKIRSAGNNKEFEQAIMDIEHGASYQQVAPLIKELYDVWVTKDLLAALDHSNAMSTRYEDNAFRVHALEKAATFNIADARDWLRHNNSGPSGEQDQNILAVYSGFAVNEPKAAIQLIDEINSPYYKHKLEIRALQEWSKKEPVQAIAWLESESSFAHAIGVSDAYLAVISPMMESSPLEAETIILGMEPSAQKTDLVGVYAKKLASEDSDTAIQWAQNIGDDNAYRVAMSQTLEVMARSEGGESKAVRYAKEEPNPTLRKHLITKTIGLIAQNSPQMAATELSLLAFDQQERVAISIMSSFSKNQENAKARWLDALQNAELRKAVEAASGI